MAFLPFPSFRQADFLTLTRYGIIPGLNARTTGIVELGAFPSFYGLILTARADLSNTGRDSLVF